jgi:hypothetical protein
VLAELWALGSRRAGVASLYRGLGARAAVAALVGAFYLSSFHFFRWGRMLHPGSIPDLCLQLGTVVSAAWLHWL